MIGIEKEEYQKAYVELYKIIKKLSIEQQAKIPETFLKNLKENMDKEYNYEFDPQKNILNQEYKFETKALFVELYEKYLADEEEKEIWNKYDEICLSVFNVDKQYSASDIFANKSIEEKTQLINDENINTSVPMLVEKKPILEKFISFLKKLFRFN